jgi:pseudouridine-5'-phosphate glycosidase
VSVVRAHRVLGLPGAVVLAQSVPAAAAVDHETMEAALAAAIAAAEARGITGKAVTPFLLDQIRSATAGRSLDANLALIAANARLAAEVAVALLACA